MNAPNTNKEAASLGAGVAALGSAHKKHSTTPALLALLNLTAASLVAVLLMAVML